MGKLFQLSWLLAVCCACARTPARPASGAVSLEPAAKPPVAPVPLAVAAAPELPDAATASVVAIGPPDPATPSVALPPEGALLGLRDAPRWLEAVGGWLLRNDPALATATTGALVGAADAPIHWLVGLDRARVAWPTADLAWQFGAAGCGVFVPATASDAAAAPCATEDEASAAVQIAVLALARPSIAAALRVETFDVHGVGADAVVTATLAMPAWRARWQVRGRGDGRLVAIGWPRVAVELTRQGAAWQVKRQGTLRYTIQFGASAATAKGAVLRVPFDGRGDPDQAVANVALSGGLVPIGPVAVVLDWQPPQLRIVAAHRTVLAQPRALIGGAAVLEHTPGALTLPGPMVLSRQNATVALRDVPPGCLEVRLLGDANDARGTPIAGASIAVVRDCAAIAPTAPAPAAHDTP